MRIIAALYLGIVLVNLMLWLRSLGGSSLDMSASSLMLWLIYMATIISLLAYICQKALLPKMVWRLFFLLFVVTRITELATQGFPMSGDLEADLNRVGLYLFMVIPPALAMFYLGFLFTPKKKEKKAKLQYA